MPRIPLAIAALLGLAALPAFAQPLQQPTVVPAAPVTTPPRPTGAGPQLSQPQPSTAPRVATDPGQRPVSSSPIPSQGPAREVPVGQATPAAKARPSVNVLDVNGKPVNGMIQVAPNRVYDPATGRYHWTESAGQQQKLMED